MKLTEVRLRPTTPWRVGHGAGDRERADAVYHSDALYSAVTHAMQTLGWLEEWLAATARSEAEPAVRFSSLFPFIGRTRLIAPPKTWWPPANRGRLYTDAAKLIPLEVIRNGVVDESRWMVDGETGCMVPTGSGAPFQITVRTAAAIDRLTGVADPHRIACLEFAPHAGWWGVFAADDAVWESRVKSAFRLLADSGFGGERSRGWGRAEAPEFSDASSLLPSKANDEGAWWLLSMYSPHADDAVDWSRGEYEAAQRGGWTDSRSGVAPKKQARLIGEGSVLFAPALHGRAVDVAPDGFAHPVYRAGFALAVPAPAEPAMRQSQATQAAEAVPEEVFVPGEFDAAVKPAATEDPGEEMENEGAPAMEPTVPSEIEPCAPSGGAEPLEVFVPDEYDDAVKPTKPNTPEPCGEPPCEPSGGAEPLEVFVPGEYDDAVKPTKPNTPEPCGEPPCEPSGGAEPLEVFVPGEYDDAVKPTEPNSPEPCGEPPCEPSGGAEPLEVFMPDEYDDAVKPTKPNTPEPCGERPCEPSGGAEPLEVFVPGEYDDAVKPTEPNTPEPCGEPPCEPSGGAEPLEVFVPDEYDDAVKPTEPNPSESSEREPGATPIHKPEERS